ncbi:hypothetical protein J6590_014630 [Homalodisca vitripennis]|nr:hypothetical protein J6590_014630 [Homalodisca vitripennis]
MAGEDAPCSVCNLIIPGNGKGLYCDGFCKKWYYPSCVDISDHRYKLINEVSEKVKWYCTACAEKIDSEHWVLADEAHYLQVEGYIPLTMYCRKNHTRAGDANIFLNNLELLLTNLSRMKTHILIGGDVNSKFDVTRYQPRLANVRVPGPWSGRCQLRDGRLQMTQSARGTSTATSLSRSARQETAYRHHQPLLRICCNEPSDPPHSSRGKM